MDANMSPRIVGVVKAISEPNRIRILYQLRKADSAPSPSRMQSRCPTNRGELCACKLPDLIGLTQPAVSLHLKVLLKAGLVQVRLEGSNRMYSITPLGRRVLSDIIRW